MAESICFAPNCWPDWDKLHATCSSFKYLTRILNAWSNQEWMLSSICTFADRLEHMGWCNLHLCVAEAYKTRGRAFPGGKLRHLVTSKAGCNQASGSFLSAGSYSRYTAGCMVGGLSQFVTEVMMKTLSWLFLHPTASCWSKDSQTTSVTAEKRFFFLWHV